MPLLATLPFSRRAGIALAAAGALGAGAVAALPASAATVLPADTPASTLLTGVSGDLVVHDYAVGQYVAWRSTKGAAPSLINGAKAQLLSARQAVAVDIGGSTKRAAVLGAISRLDDAIIGFALDSRPGVNPPEGKTQKEQAAVTAAAVNWGTQLSAAVPNYLRTTAIRSAVSGASADLHAAVLTAQGSPQSAPAAQVASSAAAALGAAVAGPLAAGRHLSGSTKVDAAQLRAELTGLLVQHVEQTGIWVKDALTYGTASSIATAAYVADTTNASYLTADISDLFGSAAGEQFATLWVDHLVGYADYLQGVVTKNATLTARGDTIVRGFATDAANFFHAQVPSLTVADLQAGFLDHVVGTEQVIDAAAAHSPTQFGLAAEGVMHLADFGDALVDGLSTASVS